MHTTETDSFIEELRFPSQWQCGEGKIGQHIKLGLAGDAVNTWDLVLQQIEMVGRSQIGRWLPPEATLGPTVAITAWLHRTERIATGLKRPASWPVEVDRLPAAVTDYYRRKAGIFPHTQGVYGHIEIPDNAHWDPGGFDYPRFFERVQAAIEQEDGVSSDFEDGIRANRKNEPLKPNASASWELGWRVGESIRKAAETPKPGTPNLPDDVLRSGDSVVVVKEP